MTYTPDFRSSWAKTEWAKPYRDALDREPIDFFSVEGNEIGLRAEYDPKSGYHLFRINTMPDRHIMRWAMILGDFVHNLRGALDHMVWQLALHECNGDTPKKPTRVQFPITDTPELFRKSNNLNEIAPAHRAIIERHQPYHGWYGGRLHPFVQLRELSNVDKHRAISPVLCANGDMLIYSEAFEGALLNVEFTAGIGTPLESGAILARGTTTPPIHKHDVEVAGEATPFITLPDTPGSWVSLVPTIDEIAASVANVIREFEPLP
jgi:hypothetical protein